MTEWKMDLPITNENVVDTYAHIFAPWVRDMGLTGFDVSEGKVSACLPQSASLQRDNGAICGQAIMAAVDTIVTLAVLTTDRSPRGTVSQNTKFIRPAFNEDLIIEVQILNFGKSIAFAEAKITFAQSGKLAAHSTAEFMF